jgi:hypothetical protein
MDTHLPEYELYAIRYAERDARRRDHFIGGDPHDGPMPMDYFVWAAIGKDRSFVIDTGFTAEVAAARGRRHLRCPAESLALADPKKRPRSQARSERVEFRLRDPQSGGPSNETEDWRQ